MATAGSAICFERRLSPVMRQHHAAGDKLFSDYSGKKIAIVDPRTGVVNDAKIFVGVLGASSHTYAEATFTQTLPDWIGAHVWMFRFLGGVPCLLVPDNLKSGVQGFVLRSGDQSQLWHDGRPWPGLSG
jgi:transposase